jgi:hypothetical protein
MSFFGNLKSCGLVTTVVSRVDVFDICEKTLDATLGLEVGGVIIDIASIDDAFTE